jgi:hypothetical protein
MARASRAKVKTFQIVKATWWAAKVILPKPAAAQALSSRTMRSDTMRISRAGRCGPKPVRQAGWVRDGPDHDEPS